MRDAIIFLLVFGSLPLIWKRPAVGIMVFAWLSLMNPHRLTYGAAYAFPFAAMISGFTVLSLVAARQPKSLPITPVTVLLLLFSAWMTVTCLFALEPDLAWHEWNRVMKTFLMIFIGMMAVRTETDVKQLAIVVGLSLGFYGFKGGVFTILSGGSSHVFGPDDSYISDNNALALALIMAAPLVWYLFQQAHKRWMRYGLGALVVLTVISAAGSYSRGALLAGAAMFFFLWLKSRNKVRTGVVLLLLVPLIYLVMPQQWFGRMETIDNYQSDASALGRINAWQFAIRIASMSPTGGGYSVFTPNMFRLYAPEPENHHAAHSIYFQVLGEHGYLGLALFLAFLVLSWRCGSRVIRACKAHPERKWAADLAAMCQVSLIGYAVGGAFLTLAYYDLVYYIVSLMVMLERLYVGKGATAGAAAADKPALAASGESR